MKTNGGAKDAEAMHDPFEQIAPLELTPSIAERPAKDGVEGRRTAPLDPLDREPTKVRELPPLAVEATRAVHHDASAKPGDRGPEVSSTATVPATQAPPTTERDPPATLHVEATTVAKPLVSAERSAERDPRIASEVHATPPVASPSVQAPPAEEMSVSFVALQAERPQAHDARASREPNVVIGRISVEVVRAAPSIVPPSAAPPPPRAATPTTYNDLGLNRRFGIGQL
ncbi:hypothetical protein BH09MYX1_BH09MYX1_37850 [soil metagenome]